MSIKTESKRIGRHTYAVTQLDAVAGREAFTRFLKLSGPVLAEGLKDEAKGFAAIANSLTVEDMNFFCDLFAAQTAVTGGDFKPKQAPQLDSIFATHFADNYFEMVGWLIFSFQVNFRSFFRGLGQLMAEMKAAKGEATEDASTG